MTPENYIKGQLAEFAWREAARYGGVNNMLAVATIIRNRVRAAWFGGDWLQVIEHAIDSSALCCKGYECGSCIACESYECKQPNLHDDNFRMLLRSIDDIYSGMSIDRMTVDPNGNAALYYAELREINSTWFKQNILANPAQHPRIANVGPVTLFL